MSSIENYDDFLATLESFKELKSGISGSRIKKLTTYALEHVSDEEKLISALIDYSRNSSETHKLGSLYIIDSIGRAYLDEARAKDDYIKPTAMVGSCAHGVYVLGEAIQELLTDGINKSNEDHKEKIRMLIDIWDRSGLFQKGYLNAVRAKCFSMKNPPNKQLSDSNPNASKELPDDPKERAHYIVSNMKNYNLSNLPNFDVPSLITSSNPAEQENALQDLLLDIYDKFASLKQQITEGTDLANKTHVHRITEYGSRREREKQTKRSRSKSPRRDNFQSAYGNQNKNNDYNSAYGNLKPNQNFGTNNHHLYPEEMNVPQNPHSRPKPVSFDSSLQPNTVKVYSRTLFIGGVPMNMKEWDLANLLKPFAEVQSVILNHNRKHAFVKVYSRSEAENAFINFNKDGSLPLRTRWGVGFGPRDCCDYQHGYSIIPLHRLTDADKKWSVEAQWGGTNGQPLNTGIVFEEPDIIVGDGVSSKSISQKMPTDSNANGPTSRHEFSYNSLPPVYGQMNQPSLGAYPPPQQQDMYGQNMPPPNTNYPVQNMPMQGGNYQGPNMTSPPPPQLIQSDQGNVDASAQLNSLMSMLNQQHQHQQ